MKVNEKAIEKLQNYIEESFQLKSLNVEDPKFDKWQRASQQLLDKVFGEDAKLSNDFKTIHYYSFDLYSDYPDDHDTYLSGLNTAKNILEIALEECTEELSEISDMTSKCHLDNGANRKLKKIFISHSSDDKEYIDLFVNLLTEIGVDRNGNNIFYSSLDGYGIPLGENIYDYLKNELNQEVLVLFMLSDNYYASTACLNEMGAAWATSKEYYSVLLPTFEFNKIEGAIDPLEISFVMNNKAKLTEFKNKLEEIFEMEKLKESIWESKRDKFIENINELLVRDRYSNLSTRVDVDRVKDRAGNLQLDLRFINNSNAIKECQELLIYLCDHDDRELVIQVDYDFLDGRNIYPHENRREQYCTKCVYNNFNPRRIKSVKTKSYWETI